MVTMPETDEKQMGLLAPGMMRGVAMEYPAMRWPWRHTTARDLFGQTSDNSTTSPWLGKLLRAASGDVACG